MTVTVADTIFMMEQAIDELKRLDPKLPVGHVSYPDSGYSGDLEQGIYKIDVEVPDEEGHQVILGICFE